MCTFLPPRGNFVCRIINQLAVLFKKNANVYLFSILISAQDKINNLLILATGYSYWQISSVPCNPDLSSRHLTISQFDFSPKRTRSLLIVTTQGLRDSRRRRPPLFILGGFTALLSSPTFAASHDWFIVHETRPRDIWAVDHRGHTEAGS